MVVFLTSSFVEYQPKKYVPKPVDASNGFVENLKRYWPDHARFLVFACDPSNAREADHVTEEMHDAFSLAGFFILPFRNCVPTKNEEINMHILCFTLLGGLLYVRRNIIP